MDLVGSEAPVQADRDGRAMRVKLIARELKLPVSKRPARRRSAKEPARADLGRARTFVNDALRDQAFGELEPLLQLERRRSEEIESFRK